MTPLIAATGITYAFDDQPVLRGVDIDALAGECAVVIGPNGSGKTTLMKILARLYTPSAGAVTIDGRPAGDYSRKALARQIAYLPQQIPSQFPFSVLQVTLMGRAPHLGLLGIEGDGDMDLAMAALTDTGVVHLAGRRVNQLSGGERQRVFLARALCQAPRILLLDEPTAALDLAHQIRTMDLLAKLRQDRNLTVVMVSHDLNLAAMYGDRLFLMADGQVAASGPPDQVMSYQILESVYGCALLVDENPLGNVPRVTPVPGRHLKPAPSRTGFA